MESHLFKIDQKMDTKRQREKINELCDGKSFNKLILKVF